MNNKPSNSRRVIKILAVVLLSLVSNAQAELLTLDLKTLPSSQGWTYEGDPQTQTEAEAFTASGSSLVQSTMYSGGDSFARYAVYDVVDSSKTMRLSFTARITGYEKLSEGSNGLGFNFLIRDEMNSYRFAMTDSRIYINGSTYGMKTTVFHDYVLTIYPDGAYELTIDVNQRLYSPGQGSGQSGVVGENVFFFGDSTAHENTNAEITAMSFTVFPDAEPRDVVPEHYLTLRPDQVYEAESLATGTGFNIRDNQPGYSHTGFADFTGEGFIEWTVYVPRPSDYDVVFRYALGRGDRALAISVDGEVVNPRLNFPQSGPWKDWSVWTELGTRTQLSAGIHVIRASTTGRNGPNIDYLRLDDVGSPAFPDRVPDGSRGFGRSVTVVGDVNEDGVVDVAIGAPQTRIPSDGFHRGQITLHSGTDGSLIDIVNPINNYIRDLGGVIVALGDVNNDGVNDFGTTARGLFYVYSGADRSILRYKSAGISHADAIGDIDGDSVSEIVLGASSAAKPSGGQAQGQVYVVSGATGAYLQVINNPSPNPSVLQGLGWPVLGLGDIDGDNVPDFLASATQQVVDGRAEGQVMAFSGSNGALLYTSNNPGADELPPTSGTSGFGRYAVRLQDITGDSIDDFIVPVPFNTVDGMEKAGQAFIFSGADGSLFRTIQSPNPGEEQRFGFRAAGLPDLNNDGVPDYAVSAFNTCCEGLPDDVWYFYSGLDGSLLLIMEPGLSSSSIETLGDLDDDGLFELAIAGEAGDYRGIVHIFSFGTESGPLPPPPDGEVVSVRVRSNPYWIARNTIDLASTNGLWIAIMSRDGFDPKTVSVSSVVFGNTAAAPRGVESIDRNHDSMPDLILRYKLKDLSLPCGEQEFWVTGMTDGGTEFEGVLKLNIIGCGL